MFLHSMDHWQPADNIGNQVKKKKKKQLNDHFIAYKMET